MGRSASVTLTIRPTAPWRQPSRKGIALQISSATFSNEGTMVAQSRAVLDLGTDGQSGSLTNTGGILVASDGDLAISGNYTISGSGGIIGLKGPGGADITSDGTAASTFTNESNIDYGGEFGGSGQIGDEGFFGVTNDLDIPQFRRHGAR